MTPEKDFSPQLSFFDEAPTEERLTLEEAFGEPKKKFSKVGLTALSRLLTSNDPRPEIISLIQQEATKRRERNVFFDRGITLHESAYLYLLMTLNPLSITDNPYQHAQMIAQTKLPLLFPTANKVSATRREAIVTEQLPSIWPREKEIISRYIINALYDIVHEHTLSPHPIGQTHFTDAEMIKMGGPNRLANFVGFSEKDLLPKIKESEHSFSELTTIYLLRGRDENLNVRVTGRTDFLIVSKEEIEPGIPIYTYNLYELKSGRRADPKTKEYQAYLYQLWLLKSVLERINPIEIEFILAGKGALVVSSAEPVLEMVRINTFLIWQSELPSHRFFCERVTLPDDKETEKKLMQVLYLYRLAKDGKLKIDWSLDRSG